MASGASHLALEHPMLGPPKPHHLDQPIAVSLEDLVPAKHFYRHLLTVATAERVTFA